MAQTLIRHEQIEDVFAFRASLGSLAVQNTINYSDISGLPSLGSLAVRNDLSYTELTNLPSLGSLAVLNTYSYNDLTNLPSLGSLAVLNELSFTNLTNQPSLSSLAFQATADYLTQITNTPSLGSLAIRNDLSYTELTNLPSLGSLAQQNTVDYLTQITNLPSLGSMAIISDVVSPLNLSGATLSLSQADINHNNLGGLTTGDPHTQYLYLSGRSGQTISDTITVTGTVISSYGTVTNPAFAIYDTNTLAYTGIYLNSSALSYSVSGVRVFQFDGAGALGVNGDASTPTFSFLSDGDTGMFRVNTNVLGFTAGGVEMIRITSASVVINTTTTNGILTVRSNNGDAKVAGTFAQLDLDTRMFNFQTTVGATNPIKNDSTAGTLAQKMRVHVNGGAAERYIYLYSS